MANSPYQDTVFILDFLSWLQPSSILDIGAGFGRWGFLCRCHLGPGESLRTNAAQSLRIDAIEAFQPNINAVYESVYNRVYKGELQSMMPGLGKYDVIICSHVIEHLEKEEGRKQIAQMFDHAVQALVVGVPIADCLRSPVGGNPYEAHRSIWRKEDFSGENVLFRKFPFTKGLDVGVAIYPKSAEARWLVKTMRNPLRSFLVRHFACAMKKVARLRGRSSIPQIESNDRHDGHKSI
jgi:hypothetical protein